MAATPERIEEVKQMIADVKTLVENFEAFVEKYKDGPANGIAELEDLPPEMAGELVQYLMRFEKLSQ